uniref:Uncharacterized protein n=1 Tax=Panagrolaimus sp. ES5 TaxID=591445 RepID=A0AC34G234_9BILA
MTTSKKKKWRCFFYLKSILHSFISKEKQSVEECTGSVLRPSGLIPPSSSPQQQHQPQQASLTDNSSDGGSCTTDQLMETPCRCCKMDCWYTVAKSATHELGHVPGQAGEEEAMATLKLIRYCMVNECSEVCARPRLPFPLPMSSE